MKSLALDEKHDLALAGTGNIGIATGINAVKQNCETAMRAQVSEMIYAMQDGVPTMETVWDNFNPVQFEASARRTLSGVEGVVRVEAFYMRLDGDTLYYEAVIRTIYGPTSTFGQGIING